jgi:hypothetical protein
MPFNIKNPWSVKNNFNNKLISGESLEEQQNNLNDEIINLF